ncbi:MAG: hypothetical protein ACO3P7_14210 [bacterium]
MPPVTFSMLLLTGDQENTKQCPVLPAFDLFQQLSARISNAQLE